MNYTPVTGCMARDPTSTTPITQSTGALQYVFQMDLTGFVKMKNRAAGFPLPAKNPKTGGKGKAVKPDCA
jgi:hypothetical protein